MRRQKILIVGGGVSLFLLGAAGMVSCWSDPREDDPVVVNDTCATDKLPTNPSSPSDPKAALSSLRAYVETSATLLRQATQNEQDLLAACNAVDQELGLPTGTDIASACSGLAARITGVSKNEPPPTPGAFSTTHFVDVAFPPTCTVPPGALEKCVTSCAGPCDGTKCDSTKLAGTCAGDCLGSCTETGDALPCVGSCAGETGLDGGTCPGECSAGTCTATAWNGSCAASCPAGFTGSCAGTCTGTCDGVPINTPPASDAGADAGDGGMMGPPGPPQVARPPSNADGNCAGKCSGVCSSGANGACNQACDVFSDAGAPTPGAWGSGYCGTNGTPAPNCTGTCRAAAGAGSTTTCNGTCTQLNKKACTGVCRPLAADGGTVQCTGTLSNTICEGNVACGQNVECNNACQAAALLAATCAEPVHSELYVVSDPKLATALRNQQGKLGKALNELVQLRSALEFIGDRSLGDFTALGINGDLVRACVTTGHTNTDAARVKVTAIANANPLLTK